MNETTNFQCLLLKLTSQICPSGEVRFENSLNSMDGVFTAKTPPREPSFPWNGVFYKKRVEEFQAFTINIDFRNMFASGEVRF